MATTSCLGSALLDPLCQGVGGIGSQVFGAGANAALDAMASWVANGSTWLLGQIGSAMATSTQISITAPWFVARYQSMEGILAIFALPLLLAAALQALVQQRASLLLRAALIQLPLAMVLAGAAVQLTTMALAITDQLCTAVSGVDPGALSSLTNSLSQALTSSAVTSGSGAPTFIVLLCAVLIAVAAVVLWIELVLRSAAIYVGVLFLPLTLACSIWPALTSWSRRLIEMLVALIVAKLVIVVVLETALGALGTGQGQGFSSVITGIALLTLATMAPFTVLKLLPLFESTAAVHLEGLRQRGMATLTQGMPRQGATMALQALRSSTLPTLPLALAHATTPGAAAPLDNVGEASSESPLDGAAITKRRDSSSPPVRSFVPPPKAQPNVRQQPFRIPSDESEWQWAHPDVPLREESAKSPSLYLDRDEWGPVIRQRAKAERDD